MKQSQSSDERKKLLHSKGIVQTFLIFYMQESRNTVKVTTFLKALSKHS